MWRPLLLAILLVAAPAPAPCAGQAFPPADASATFFPMNVGDRWTYEGHVRADLPATDEIYEAPVVWAMEVVERIDRGDLRAAILLGHPSDLMWFEPGREPTRSILVSVGADAYYLVRGPRAADVEARLRNTEDSLIGLLRDHELILDLPLYRWKRFCEIEQRTRTDLFYCWVIEEVDDERGRYRVTQRTVGDHRFIVYEDGVGIVRYIAGHHGTVSEVDVRLVGFETARP